MCDWVSDRHLRDRDVQDFFRVVDTSGQGTVSHASIDAVLGPNRACEGDEREKANAAIKQLYVYMKSKGLKVETLLR